MITFHRSTLTDVQIKPAENLVANQSFLPLSQYLKQKITKKNTGTAFHTKIKTKLIFQSFPNRCGYSVFLA